MTCGAARCAICLRASLHQIGAVIHVPIAYDIDAELDVNPSADIIAPFSENNVGIDILRV